MKYAIPSKSPMLAVLFIALTLALTGCGGTTSNTLTAPSGNWSMTAVSTTPSIGTFYIGGNLTQNGSSLSARMYAISYCIDPAQQLAFSGTINGSQVTLTSAADPAGEVVTVVGTLSNGSMLSGSYSVTGGSCANGDHGSINANPVASITGTWSGSIADPNWDPSASLSIALTQASTASADGTFALTGTLTYQNSICEASGTINTGALYGPAIGFTATTVAGDTIYYSGGILDSTTTPKNITVGTYSVVGGACDGETANPNPTFTKQ